MQGMPIQLLTPAILNTKGGDGMVASPPGEAEDINNKDSTNFEGLLSGLLAANSDKALGSTGPEDINISVKLASSSSNLDELIHSMKNKNPSQIEARLNSSEELDEATIIPGREIQSEEDAESGSPLDFLIKEGKPRGLGEIKGQSENDLPVKKFVSSEEFIGLRNEVRNSKNTVGAKKEIIQNELDSKVLDFAKLASKQNPQNDYGGVKNLLSDNLIRSTRDLAFNDRKSKIDFDELKNPDLKIGSDLSMIKESFIPNVQNLENQTDSNVTQGQKVLDLSSISSTNTNEIIKNISNYIEQNQIMNADTMDLNVKHAELGQFKILVTKNIDPNVKALDMQIVTTTTEGQDFFVKNEIGLIKTLSQAGVQLSDFKLVQGSENTNLAQGDSRHNHNSHTQTAKDFMNSEGGKSGDGSERRQELWQEARNLQQRFGA